MKNRIVALLASVLMTLGVLAVGASPAEAHSPCTGVCNKIQNISNVGIGIYDYASNQQWRWIQNPQTWSNSSNLWQADVEGFWIGTGYCFQVYQSNDGVNYGYWGAASGPYHFTTSYWVYNKVVVWLQTGRC